MAFLLKVILSPTALACVLHLLQMDLAVLWWFSENMDFLRGQFGYRTACDYAWESSSEASIWQSVFQKWPEPLSAPPLLTFLSLLLSRGLWGHVDGGCGHRDGAPARHQIQLNGFPGDEGGRHLHLLRQAQVGAEAGHEVSGGDEVHASLQGLQDQLETAADLLLGDARDGADFWRRKRHGLVRSLLTWPAIRYSRAVYYEALLFIYCSVAKCVTARFYVSNVLYSKPGHAANKSTTMEQLLTFFC